MLGPVNLFAWVPLVPKIDVRVVGATNLSMLEAIKKGKFREDLYYRLNTVEIQLPPLRERPSNIHLLLKNSRPILQTNIICRL